MKFTTALIATTAFVMSVSGMPVKRDVDPNLVPQFGLQAGLNPTGTGDCDGIPGGPKIPCSCPPDRAEFIRQLNANVNAGHAVNNPSVAVQFPTSNSKEDQIARIQASLVTLQNLKGPGVGCPAASTTFVKQQQAIESGAAPPAPPPAAPAPPPPPPAAAPPAGGVPANLIPEYGLQAGLNPTGTGDCDGIPGGPKIPCFCPPDRNDFIKQLNDNVAAGHAVKNPAAPVSFPTGNSNDDQRQRLLASLITLQNMRGSGVGCPAASTTWVKQLNAL
ncbi:hypothetical protein E1B28_012748 [Marasmius oreades]|uniref:Uncharacterized protein n=1 Tax=Marasmius oreades TaxID=181124 RepID=A0A9P7RSD6_9AGAR|nr:uncharacterized protein E1B28_012748 [Marasmius oreades]KAG7088782.1 hypothetical protein E1B28_012748 [Marasmius oreades]